MAYSGGYGGGYSDPTGASSAGSSTVVGDLVVAITLAGFVNATSSVSAKFAVDLRGTINATSSVSATGMTSAAALAGQANGRSATGYADLTVQVTWRLEGQTHGVAGASGSVGVTWALGGRVVSRSSASATVVPDPTFTFLPPILNDRPSVLPETHGVQRRLFRYYAGNPRGVSVVGPYPTYMTVDSPYADVLVGTEGVDYFLGGHRYTVNRAVAAALTAAGYGADLS